MKLLDKLFGRNVKRKFYGIKTVVFYENDGTHHVEHLFESEKFIDGLYAERMYDLSCRLKCVKLK